MSAMVTFLGLEQSKSLAGRYLAGQQKRDEDRQTEAQALFHKRVKFYLDPNYESRYKCSLERIPKIMTGTCSVTLPNHFWWWCGS